MWPGEIQNVEAGNYKEGFMKTEGEDLSFDSIHDGVRAVGTVFIDFPVNGGVKEVSVSLVAGNLLSSVSIHGDDIAVN